MESEYHLTEYDKRDIFLSPSDADILRKELNGKLDVQPTDTPGAYTLCTNSYVGVVSLPRGQTLSIRPKILGINSLFYLLNVAYDPMREFFLDYKQTYTTIPGLFEFVVSIYVKHVEEIISQGILKGYRVRNDDMVSVKGRMLFAETLRHRPGLHDRHYCSYSNICPDLPENRILRWTTFCLRHYIYQERSLGKRLHRIGLAFSEVELDAQSRRLFDKLRVNRLNNRYYPTLDLAKLLLDHITFSGSVGGNPFLAFLVDMNWLFERYLSTILSTAAKQWDIQAREQAEYSLDKDSEIKVRPDIVLSNNGKPLLVVDAKYKLEGKHADLYQMLAYCHALGSNSAALVYPSNEQAMPSCVSINGPGDVQVRCISLNLKGEPSDIKAQGLAFVGEIKDLLDL